MVSQKKQFDTKITPWWIITQQSVLSQEGSDVRSQLASQSLIAWKRLLKASFSQPWGEQAAFAYNKLFTMDVEDEDEVPKNMKISFLKGCSQHVWVHK